MSQRPPANVQPLVPQSRDYWHEDTDRKEKIASFGEAVITRDLRGRFEIRGGTDAERKEAHDWLLSWMRPVGNLQS